MRLRFTSPAKYARYACVGVLCAAAGIFAGVRLERPRGGPPAPRRPADVEAALDRALPEVDLDGVPFARAVRLLGEAAGVRIDVDWGLVELDRPIFDPDKPIHFRARDVTLARALDVIVRQVGAEGYEGWAVVGDAVRISTTGQLSYWSLCARAYRVDDLIGAGGAFDWPGTSPLAAAGGGRTAPGGVASLESVENLERLLENTVDPDSWKSSGGRPAFVSFVAGRLVVVQTWENQREIARLLSRLRTAGPIPPPAPSPDTRVWDERHRRFVPAVPDAVETSLRQVLPRVRMDGVPLTKAVGELGALSGTDLAVDWAALWSQGIKPEAPVAVYLSDVTLGQALRAVLDQTGHGGGLTYGPFGGSVLITIRQNAGRLVVTRTYDVRDWLANAIRDASSAPTAAPQSAPPSGLPLGPQLLPRQPRSLAEEEAERLTDVVRWHVDIDSWEDVGGKWGRIMPLNGWLVVTHLWETQEKVADLLAALRADPGRMKSLMAAPASPAVPTTAPATHSSAEAAGGSDKPSPPGSVQFR